ncbi:MAG TPA: DUF1127 domain-containing protein [Acetobacteraceae bacterium]|nr:DUF1127 domain-containing protein [Acetobacteraceae bacterium]
MFGSTLFGFAPSLPSGDGPKGANRPGSWGKLVGPLFGGRPGHAGARHAHRLVELLRRAWRRQRSRNCLARMDGYMLKDIGLTYAEAEAELNKPFWIS